MNTKTCSSCHKEKNTDQFSLRGRGETRRDDCKACVSLKSKERYAMHGRARTTTSPVINKSNIPAIAEIVASIEPHLRAKASRYSSDPIEADDVYGVMVEAILTKSDPTDSAARMLGRADWAATEYLHKKQTYDYRVESSDDDSSAFMTKTSAEDELVERETSKDMRNIIAQLPTDYQQVVSFLAVGLTQREIAKKLEISEQAVSQKVKRIGTQMMNLGLSPA